MQALATLGLLAGSAAADTVFGAVVFTRHGDRTTKHYGNQQLTRLGATQNFQVGGTYRARYLQADSEHRIQGISQDEYVGGQIYASAPNERILSNTATAFLQGLYPPLGGLDEDMATEQLNNDTASTAPLDGYQYVMLEGVDEDAPGSIWIKGDDGCPAYTSASNEFQDSSVFRERAEDTRDFYGRMYEYVGDVYDLTPDDMGYENAYAIFDLINVARIHNQSAAALDVSDEDMEQLRTLADSAEFGSNYNATQPARSVGAQTLAGGVLAQLDEMVSGRGQLKLALLAGSYDTFLAFFGVMGLADLSVQFRGLPVYASTMAFELYAEGDGRDFPAESDLRVRWMLKNGTEGALTTYPLFGLDEDTLPWPMFREQFGDRAISDVGEWCRACSSTQDFCAAYRQEGESSQGSSGRGGMSNAVAGVIGAVVTLAVVGIVGAVAFTILRRRSRRNAQRQASIDAARVTEKRAGSMESDSA